MTIRRQKGTTTHYQATHSTTQRYQLIQSHQHPHPNSNHRHTVQQRTTLGRCRCALEIFFIPNFTTMVTASNRVSHSHSENDRQDTHTHTHTNIDDTIIMFEALGWVRRHHGAASVMQHDDLESLFSSTTRRMHAHRATATSSHAHPTRTDSPNHRPRHRQ